MIAVTSAIGVVASAGTALAQTPALANVCTGLGVGVPALAAVGTTTSGLLGGALDPVLNGVVGSLNSNVVNVLSGRTLGLGVLDGSGHVVTVGPGGCNVSADTFNIENQRGITVGGGQVSGLGGAGNPTASAGAVNAIAIGNGASTAPGISGAVALGSGATALRPGLSGGSEAFSGTVVGSGAGAVSIGAPGAERQITNVAGGTAATDAANIRQLYAVGSNLATSLGGGARFDPTTGAYRGPTYAIRGTLYGDVGSALAALDRDPGLVQQDSTTRTITIGGNTDGRVINISGTAGDRRLTGVADGTAPNDAATVGQVATLVDNVPLRGNNALGRPAPVASGADALAGGYGARATGAASTAFGNGASAGGERSVAIGNGARADQAGAVAIGAGAATTRANQVAIGTARSTYTMPGIASAESAAAQVGSTRFVTTDAGGNLAASAYGPGSIAALEGRMSGAESRIAGAEARIAGVERYATESRREARQGIAAAMAMTSASMPSAPGRTSWAANTTAFRGEWATGGAVAHRLDTAVPLAVTAGYSYGGGNSHGVRVGLGGEF